MCTRNRNRRWYVAGLLSLVALVGVAAATRDCRPPRDGTAGLLGTGKTMWDTHACPNIAHR
jgi:hypothetical protein